MASNNTETKLMSLMEIFEDNKDKLSEGDYLKGVNLLKEIYDTAEDESGFTSRDILKMGFDINVLERKTLELERENEKLLRQVHQSNEMNLMLRTKIKFKSNTKKKSKPKSKTETKPKSKSKKKKKCDKCLKELAYNTSMTGHQATDRCKKRYAERMSSV